MKQRVMGKLVGLVGGMMLAGCAAEYVGYTEYEGDEAETQETYGAAREAVSACVGDSNQYDFNAFAASLAVAAAKDLGEWDTANNFSLSADKSRLVLSATAAAACGTGCLSVKDVLLLQEDVTSIIPNHSPSEFRSHLVTWYNANMARLTELSTESRLPPGTYTIKNKNAALKPMVMDASSLADNAKAELGPLAGTAGNWIVTVEGTKWRIKNQNSGKCLDLASASSADNVNFVQKPCSTAATQLFEMVKDPGGLYAIKDTYGKFAIAFNWGTANDTAVVQAGWMTGNMNGQWQINPVGATTNPAQTVFQGMYTLKFANTYSATTDLNLVAAPISAAEGAQVKLASYSASNPNRTHQWYATIVNSKYQFINRGTGKCLALASDTSTALLVQKTCAVNDSQLFTPGAQTPAEEFTLKTRYNTLLEAQNAGQTAGVAIAQTATASADPQRRIKFSPIMAALPHKLTFDHVTHDGPCGDYFWYNITQPSGAAVADPLNSYIDLIAFGGKRTSTGADENPFIAQISGAGQVAIDPSGYVAGGGGGATGSCIATEVYTDLTKLALGACCIKNTGLQSTFKVSAWSPTTFVCQ